jgi:hypothetical protein
MKRKMDDLKLVSKKDLEDKEETKRLKTSQIFKNLSQPWKEI